MKKRDDLVLLFLFVLILSSSTLILFQCIWTPHFLMASPLSRFGVGDFSLQIQEIFHAFSKPFSQGERFLYHWMPTSMQRPLAWIQGEMPLLHSRDAQEEKTLPVLNFQGVGEVHFQGVGEVSPLPPGEIFQEEFQLEGEVPPVPREDWPGEERRLEEEGARSSLSPAVLILHSHTAETYRDDPFDIGTGHAAPGEEGLITAVGEELATTLTREYGHGVHHEKRVHDEQYALSYQESRATLQSLLTRYPTPGMVLDIHRDALGFPLSQEIKTVIQGEEVARILIVVASDELGLSHPQWRKNLQFAYRLGERMETLYPGLLRRVEVRENRLFNQDLHPQSLLLEMGDYRNTSTQALASARLLAHVLHSLLKDP